MFMQCAPSPDMRGAKAGQQHLTSHVHQVDALYALFGFAVLTDFKKSKPGAASVGSGDCWKCHQSFIANRVRVLRTNVLTATYWHGLLCCRCLKSGLEAEIVQSSQYLWLTDPRSLDQTNKLHPSH